LGLTEGSTSETRQSPSKLARVTFEVPHFLLF